MNIELAIKIYFMNVFIYITCLKIINNKKINYIKIIIYSIITTFMYIIIRKYSNNIFSIVVQYFTQLLFLKDMIDDKNKRVMIGNLMANSIVYVVLGVAATIEFIFIKMLKINNSIINIIITIIIAFIILIFLSKIKRVKNGFSFLNNKADSEYIEIIMITISSIVILGYCLFGNYYGDVTKNIFLTFTLLAIFMVIMIQKALVIHYNQKLLYKTIEDYKSEIASKDEQIKKLSEEKFKISKLNHEFYNRQKALENKVKDFVSNSNVEASSELSIMESINNLSKGYSSELEKIKSLDKLPVTDIEEIDDMFKYMQSECKNNNIDFKLQVNGNIHHMVNKIIPQDRLVTLIGDHLRDAIIAINAGDNKFRSILAILGVKNECYELCVYDSGVEFTIDTLEKLGIEPITTHKDSGGSGIGFITTFETMRQTGASLIIDEKCKPSENDYTKSVVIRFDGKNEYRIFSYRAKKIKNKIKDNRAIIKDRI